MMPPSMSLQRAVVPADWTSGVEDAFRAFAKILKTAFWVAAAAMAAESSADGEEGGGAKRAGWVVRMSDRMCRDVVWRAS